MIASFDTMQISKSESGLFIMHELPVGL